MHGQDRACSERPDGRLLGVSIPALTSRGRVLKLIDLLSDIPIPFAYRMAFIVNFYRAPLLRRIEQQYGLIRPEWTVLICLRQRDGLNARDICEFTEQPRNTVSRGVALLARKALIRIEADDADARRTLLYLTPEGRALHDRIMALSIEGEQRMIACLNPAERAQLGELLEKVARSVDQWKDWVDAASAASAAQPPTIARKRPRTRGP